MLLDTVNKKVQARLVEAAVTVNPVFTTTYADITSAAFTPAAGEGSFNGTAAIDLVAAPAASTFRHVKEIQINNTDTIDHSFTVWVLDGVTSYIVVSSILVPKGNSLRYSDTAGWAVGVALGSGTVTSVGLSMPAEFTTSGSPITLSGTLAVAKATQAANTFYVGPASGAASVPTFRTLSVNDPIGWGFTAGSIPFMTATGIAQNNANFFWDNVNNRLGIGTSAADQILTINGTAAAINSVIEWKLDNVAQGFSGIARTADNLILGAVAGDTIIRSQGHNILFSSDSGVTAQLYLKNGGNIGIGTINPAILLDVAGPIGAKVYTVATLPSATVKAGQLAFVSDATLTAITGLGLAPTGGGTNFVPVYSDGAGWKII